MNEQLEKLKIEVDKHYVTAATKGWHVFPQVYIRGRVRVHLTRPPSEPK